MTDRPHVSVVIPCRDEAPFIGQCLESVLAFDYPADRLEILVVDGMSRDQTRETVAAWSARDARIQLLDNPRGITPVALNIGIRAACGDYIVRLDAHNAYEVGYVRECIDHALRSQADNVGGVIETIAREPGLLGEAMVAAMTHPFGVGPSHFRLGSDEPRWVDTVFGGCFRRQVFDRVGLFNELLPRGQDMEFSLRLRRAGLRTLLVPTIRSRYYARTRPWQFLSYNWSNGVWAVLPFLYSKIIPVGIRHLVPMAFVGALLTLAILAPWVGWARLLLALLLGAYALAAVAAALHVAWQHRNARFLLLMPPVFLGFHLSYGLGSLWGAVKVVAGVLRGERAQLRTART